MLDPFPRPTRRALAPHAYDIQAGSHSHLGSDTGRPALCNRPACWIRIGRIADPRCLRSRAHADQAAVDWDCAVHDELHRHTL